MSNLQNEIDSLMRPSKVSYVFQYTLGYRESCSTDNGNENHPDKEKLAEHMSRIISIWRYATKGKCDLFMHISNSANERVMITVGCIDDLDMTVSSIWTKSSNTMLHMETTDDLDELTEEIQKALMEI